MQIRVANKQDESAIRALFQSHLAEFNREIDVSTDGSESDLRNIEGNYFGRDGIFLVASLDKDIVALAGGRRQADREDVFHIKRLFVSPTFRRQKVASQMISIISRHAGVLGFTVIEASVPEHLFDEAEPFLKKAGFKLAAKKAIESEKSAHAGNTSTRFVYTFTASPSIKACGTQTCN